MIVITDSSPTPIAPARWEVYEAAVVDVLELLRPDNESWKVTIVETATALRFDFARSIEDRWTLTMALTVDEEHLLMSLCKFVWTYWPTDGSD